MSIMPGMESRAPERTATSSGMPLASPNLHAHDLLHVGDAGFHLRLEFLGIGPLVGVEVGADLGGDGEAGRHGQTDAGHLGEVRALAAEERLHGAVAVGFFVAPGVDVFDALCGGFFDGRLGGGFLVDAPVFFSHWLTAMDVD